MSAAGTALVVLPVLGYLTMFAALRMGTGTRLVPAVDARRDRTGKDTPVGPVVAPGRLAAVWAALAIGGYAVVVVELLGAFNALTRPAIALAWLVFLLVALALAARAGGRAEAPTAPAEGGPATPDGRWAALRAGRAELPDRARGFWRTAGRGERLLFGALAGLVLVELVIALLAEPNNYDSQTYHLPKIERWVSQQSLEFWATSIDRQVTIPPGAEYLLLHLRLLTGGDVLHNLLQWAAGVGCLLAISRIAAQLGGGRRAQLVAAFVFGTTPMVALQATSTQTDLVVAAWVGCLATLVLDGLRRRVAFGSALALGTATGLIAITKTSGLIGAGPLLVLWGLGQLRLAWTQTTGFDGRTSPAAGSGGGGRRVGGVLRTGLATLAILITAGALTGPFLSRVTDEFGHPLGPPMLRHSVPMQKHDPGSIVINALRIGQTALDTPLTALNHTPARVVTGAAPQVIEGTAELIGVDPQDRATTFGRTRYPVPSWYPDEDRVAFPVLGTLGLIAGALALARPRRIVPNRAGTLRGYALAVAVTLALHPAMIKWQPWGNRLLIYTLVLAAPLIGCWVDSLFRRRSAAISAANNSAAVSANATNSSATILPTAAASASAGGTSTIIPSGTTSTIVSDDSTAGSTTSSTTVSTSVTVSASTAGRTPTGAETPARTGTGGRRPLAATLVAAMLAGSALAGVLAVSYGFPRRLVGAGSLFTTSDWDTRFLRRPSWAEEFRWAADAVRDSGARRVGLVQQNDNWEYPWWLLLVDHTGNPDRADSSDNAGREIVALQSIAPKHPPADPNTVDAIVCTGDRAACERLVPENWQLVFRGYVGYALPPGPR